MLSPPPCVLLCPVFLEHSDFYISIFISCHHFNKGNRVGGKSFSSRYQSSLLSLSTKPMIYFQATKHMYMHSLLRDLSSNMWIFSFTVGAYSRCGASSCIYILVRIWVKKGVCRWVRCLVLCFVLTLLRLVPQNPFTKGFINRLGCMEVWIPCFFMLIFVSILMECWQKIVANWFR